MSLKIILGSMFSGKSSEIIRIIKRFRILKKQMMIINHTIDNRYDTSKIVSHDQEKIDCLAVDKLIPLLETEDYRKSDVIVIEEAQFFGDLFNFVTTCLDKYSKTVVIAGLDGDYKKEPFGDILRLIPHAESVIKLHALCTLCGDGTKASFTKRIVKCNDDVLVGSTESYIPVCRIHHMLN